MRSLLNPVQTTPFWRRLLIALGFMTLSGILLLSGFLVSHLKELKSFQVTPKVWFGKELQLIEGKGTQVGKALEIGTLSSRGQAIVSSGRIALAAEDYPILEYQLEGLRAEMNPVFFWRSENAPEDLRTLPLEGHLAGSMILQLAQHSTWRGNIIEFGIGFRQVLLKPVIINAFIFKPASITSLWSAFEGWSQRSINFIEGGARTALVAPVLAAAVWVGLAILLYGMGGLFLPRPQRWDRPTIGIIFLLGWVTIDGRWQVGLWHQLQETYERYAGKDWREKHLAAEDAPLFQFITGVKAQLPAKPQRIFLVVAKSLKDNYYTRSRARYHLLPHNIYDYGVHLPEPEYVRAGDYVLMLGPLPELSIGAERQFLQWHGGKRKHYVLKKIYTAPKGILYKVLSPTSHST